MTNYFSDQKYNELKEELAKRRTTIRREIAERISAAKEMGDLSENFEYQEAKEQQSQNEQSIAELDSILFDAVIVGEKKGGAMIGLGNTFEVKFNGQKKQFTVVGSSEADPLTGKISNESPTGQAFLGKAEGETVEINTPSGKIQYTINKIL